MVTTLILIIFTIFTTHERVIERAWCDFAGGFGATATSKFRKVVMKATISLSMSSHFSFKNLGLVGIIEFEEFSFRNSVPQRRGLKITLVQFCKEIGFVASKSAGFFCPK